jgi:hypothetical protein
MVHRQRVGDLLALARVRRHQYAARLGQGPALARTLEHSSLPYERSIRKMRFSRASHPYTKPRIAKLRAQPTPPALTPNIDL